MPVCRLILRGHRPHCLSRFINYKFSRVFNRMGRHLEALGGPHEKKLRCREVFIPSCDRARRDGTLSDASSRWRRLLDAAICLETPGVSQPGGVTHVTIVTIVSLSPSIIRPPPRP